MAIGTESCGLKILSLSASEVPSTAFLVGGNEGDADMILVHRQLSVSRSRKTQRYVHC